MKTKTIRTALAAICVAAAVPSYADTNITEYVKLTEDADWSSLGTVNIAADAGIHLNGHNLTVAGFTGAGSIYSSALPPGYAELEYVYADAGQYIDTGIRPDGESKIVADVTYTGNTGSNVWQPLISASNGGNNNIYGVWIWPVSNVSKWSVAYNGVDHYSSCTVVANTRYAIEATWGPKSANRTMKINGTSYTLNKTSDKSTTAVAQTMFLPARNRAGAVAEKSKFKIYSFSIYKPQTTLVRKYIPAKRLSDEVPGLYDTVSGTFFPSVSETAFAEGPEVGRSGGELRINVASGTFQNSTVAISNSVKVVKLGAGTYTSNKYQTYTGGTDVKAGKISFARTASTAPTCGFGTWGSAINVASNAQVVINADYQTLNGYNVTIAGDGPDGNGAIYGNASGSQTAWNFSYIGSLSLSGDASIKTIADDAFDLNLNRQGIDIALNGHTLTANGSARFIVWSAHVLDSGRIVSNISPGSNGANSCFYTHGNGVSAPLADFEVAQGKALGGEQPLTVSNLVMRGAYYPRNGVLYNVTVLGRYSPKSTCGGFPKVTLGDATHLSPVFDLSDRSATYDGSRGVAFAEGSTVTVYVGARTVNVGDKLVSWNSGSVPDISVSFALTGDGWTAAEREIALTARGDGLYVKTTVAPAYATLDVANDEWQFFAADGTPYPDEWTDGVTSDMQVRFSSYEEYVAIKAKGVSPSMFIMTGFTMPEGIGEVDATVGMVYQFDEGIVIDINGNSLKLPSSMMFGDKAFTVTSSVAGGEVVIDVPSGTSRNTSMTLAGSLKVTKKGAGTFVSALSQTYTGGTDVEAGTVRPPDSPADNNYTYSGDSFMAFGTGPVNVLTGAVFDVRGNYAYTNIVLKGGTIANTLRTMNQTAKPGVFVSSLADADVSHFNMYLSGIGKYDTSYGMAGLATDLGGKTLEITEWGGLHLRSALTNGTVKVVESNGWFMFEAALDMRTTTFDNLCALQVNANVELGEYIQRKDTKYILGSSKMTVHRRFCPISSTYFYGCTLADGCTFDLSQRETLFTTSCTNHENKVYSVSYADNATIKVKLGARKVRSGTKIVGWTSKPTNSVKFIAAEDERRRAFAIKDDGLYVYSGFVLIVK